LNFELMEIENKQVLILGGSGLVGMAVARELLRHTPASLALCSLTRAEAEGSVAELLRDPSAQGVRIEADWGDIFLPESLKDRTRADVIRDDVERQLVIDDLYGELSEDMVRRSMLGSLVARRRPDIIVDCVNTATAIAYQNLFDSAARLREQAAAGEASLEAVEQHLATLYMPQLIRHVQILLESVRRAGTSFYLKVGTAGTGGMGLNIPFTHSEERPSRMLLAKASVAGAHTLLLYLMARTPGAPAVKEVKPTAAVSWKRIAFGPVTRRGSPIQRFDAKRPLPLETAFAEAANGYMPAGGNLEGVFLDAGENGLFSLAEFEALTALGLMEYITPEEIAETVVREIRGYPTGRDVVAALDASTSGPTYRAGVLREAALERMADLESKHGVSAVAYEMLGPPRLSKLLFEGAILGRLFPDLRAVARMEPDDAARRAAALIDQDDDLRVRIVSIGLPILLPDGAHLLRGPEVKSQPDLAHDLADPRLADNGWVDLRPSNWRRWSQRAARMIAALDDGFGTEMGSRDDVEPDHRRLQVRPGTMAAWVFRHEDRGARVKR
jgi:NAD(P)-dependent dehydrogenase (short-subunit alcohol dehydrogenase family)